MLINKKNLYLNLIFVGLILYSLFGLLFSVYSLQIFRVPQIFGIIFFLIAIFFSKKYKYSKSIIFLFFFFWEIIIVLRMKDFSSNVLVSEFLDPINLMTYFIPLVFLNTVSLNHILYYLKIIFFTALIFWALHLYLIYEFPINNLTDTIAITTSSTAGILLLMYSYLNKKQVYFCLIIILSNIFIGMVYGRRSVILISLLFILFTAIHYFIINEKISKSRKVISLTLLSIGLFIAFQFSPNLIDVKGFEILNRVNVDTRSDVFNAFHKDFEFEDYFFGRGIDGTYLNPMNYWNFKNDDFREVSHRSNIENGYLYMIMKGGIIYLGLFLAMVFQSLYYGFYKSKNNLSKALSFYIFIYLMDMVTYGQPGFNLKYFLLWICISLLYNKKFRDFNESEINSFFKTNLILKTKR